VLDSANKFSYNSPVVKKRSVRNRRIAMKLVPLFDKVVLEKEKMEETTKSGIVLPGQDDKEKPGSLTVK